MAVECVILIFLKKGKKNVFQHPMERYFVLTTTRVQPLGINVYHNQLNLNQYNVYLSLIIKMRS